MTKSTQCYLHHLWTKYIFWHSICCWQSKKAIASWHSLYMFSIIIKVPLLFTQKQLFFFFFFLELFYKNITKYFLFKSNLKTQRPTLQSFVPNRNLTLELGTSPWKPNRIKSTWNWVSIFTNFHFWFNWWFTI